MSSKIYDSVHAAPIPDSRQQQMQAFMDRLMALPNRSGSSPGYAKARLALIAAYQNGTDQEFNLAAESLFSIAKKFSDEISARKNSNSQIPKTENANSPASPSQPANHLAARFCRNLDDLDLPCGSPAFWISVYDLRSSAPTIRCRECEPPPSKAMIGQLLYAYQPGGPGTAPEWETPPIATTLAGSPSSTPGSSDAGWYELTEQIRCADGSTMLARKGWDNLQSVWVADSLQRLTITEPGGFEEAWQIHAEHTARFFEN